MLQKACCFHLQRDSILYDLGVPNYGRQVAVTTKFLYGDLSSITNCSQVTILAPRDFGVARGFLGNVCIPGPD